MIAGKQSMQAGDSHARGLGVSTELISRVLAMDILLNYKQKRTTRGIECRA